MEIPSKQSRVIQAKDFPPEIRQNFDYATRMEWITVAYTVSAVIVMILTSQSSQAMKVAWLEDVLSLVPPVSFLVAKIFYLRPPNSRFPFGFHRVYSIAFQLGAFALLSLGLFLFTDSLITLIKADRPTIGAVKLFGQHYWFGWIMIAALLYSAVPPMILGYKKLPVAHKLHNKILFTDADTQKANWETALAAIAGVVGIGFGFWWADAAAAIFISLSIVFDGAKRLKEAVLDLTDQAPTEIGSSEKHPLVDQVYDFFEAQPWIEKVRIRMREAGDVFFTEVFFIPATADNLMEEMEKATAEARELDWKIFDVVLSPVKEFTEEQEESGN